jgi:NAD(P)-dependent dehydrogenase (short-subunit alcohol dehydrogenase family)
MDLGLAGRKAIVTGGGRGIGRWITSTLLDEGCEVAICGRTPESITSTVEEFSSRGTIIGDVVDVTDGVAFPAWVDSAAQRLGGLDLLVLNASIQPSGDDDATWELTFQSDLMQAVRGIRAARPHLAAAGSGAVVLISSTTALSQGTGPGQTAYGTVKSALLSYGSKMAALLGPEGIRVNTVIPGVILFPGSPMDLMKDRVPGMIEGIAKGTVLGRIGEPQEVANTVAFLGSPRASYITGASLRVDGGVVKSVDFS